jgi:ketosteroid isomerase-like protein
MSDWLEDYFGAWNECDHERIAEYLADDVVFEDVAHGHRHEGKAAASKAIRSACAALPPGAFELLVLHSTDTNWYVEWRMNPPGVQGISVGTLRDGKITLSRDYWNPSPVT